MEIKTIEELACIPVENDDFAAASDQDEGDVILRPSLNYWQDAWRRLRKNRWPSLPSLCWRRWR